MKNKLTYKIDILVWRNIKNKLNKVLKKLKSCRNWRLKIYKIKLKEEILNLKRNKKVEKNFWSEEFKIF